MTHTPKPNPSSGTQGGGVSEAKAEAQVATQIFNSKKSRIRYLVAGSSESADGRFSVGHAVRLPLDLVVAAQLPLERHKLPPVRHSRFSVPFARVIMSHRDDWLGFSARELKVGEGVDRCKPRLDLEAHSLSLRLALARRPLQARLSYRLLLELTPLLRFPTTKCLALLLGPAVVRVYGLGFRCQGSRRLRASLCC